MRRAQRSGEATLAEENTLLRRELEEANERQAATSEVLRAIASSPGELTRVLDVIVGTAQRLLQSSGASITRIEDGVPRRVAVSGIAAQGPAIVGLRLDRGSPAGRAILDKKTVHVEDILEDPAEFPSAPAVLGQRPVRTVVATPLMREGEPIGSIALQRVEMRPFSAKEIQLLESFADQAVIAIENARLLAELRESLEHQTATSDILRVIAESTTDVEPVMTVISENAARLCAARDVRLYRVSDGFLRATGALGSIGSLGPDELPIDSGSLAGRAVIGIRLVHVDDAAAIQDELVHTKSILARARFGSVLGVPMMREGRAVGVIIVLREEVAPFSQKQRDLIASFADQAAIALENARLLSELRESLETQTASADILRTIAASPAEPDKALDTIAQTTARLFGAAGATIRTVHGDRLRFVGAAGAAAVGLREAVGAETPLDPHSLPGHVVLTKRPLHVPDIEDLDPGIAQWPGWAPQLSAGIRTVAGTPLMREGQAIGALMVRRSEMRPFTEKEMAQLANFADQAVIAIENARLLSELHARNRDLSEGLEREKASAEILRTIASTPGEPKRALDMIAETAVRMFGATSVGIRRAEGNILRYVGSAGPASDDIRQALPEIVIDRSSFSGLVVLESRQIHVADFDNDDRVRRMGEVTKLSRNLNNRTFAMTPLLREGEATGVMSVNRSEVRPFTDKELAVMSNFADQAAIAIENARLLDELNTRNEDLSESLERQTASAEVLRAIAASPGDADLVLDTIVNTARRLFAATFASVTRLDGDTFRQAATAGDPADYIRGRLSGMPVERNSVAGRAVLDRRTIYVDDVQEQGLALGETEDLEVGQRSRTLVSTPLMREGEAIGTLTVGHADVRPYTDKQIELLETFADQAVIAIENARLLRELRESLETQTASAEILRTIAASPADAGAALDTISATTARLFGAAGATILTVHGDKLRAVGSAGPAGKKIRAAVGDEIPITSGTLPGSVVLTKQPIHIPDLDNPDPERADWPGRAPQRAVGMRTVIGVPLMREGQAIGALMVQRAELRPFADKEIAQLANFADQAVIAIENTRLLSELRESLERRTATADVLAAISASPGDVQPVFETMLDNAVRLCEASEGSVFTLSGDMLRRVASRGLAADLVAYDEVPAAPGTPPGRMLNTLKTVHIPDLMAEIRGVKDVPAMAAAKAAADRGARSALWVPMIKDKAVVGAFILNRREARPFTETQIGLVENFADQAVIAIENARLLEELRESLDRRTAIAEVLQVISSSPGELQPVFETMLTSAVKLCDAWTGSVFRIEGELFRRVTSVNLPPELSSQVELRYAADLPAARMLDSKSTVHIVDVMAELQERPNHPTLRMAAERTGALSALWVPMVKDNEVVAAFVLARREARAFTEAQIGLVENFASQAVIAIDNARLLAELREARDAAERNLVELRAAQASLIQAEKMASLGQLTAGIAHEIKNPLNFVNNFAGLSVELLDELKQSTAPAIAGLAEDKRDEVAELIGMLTGNLEKIAEHGGRADGIVKSMLAHSRGGSGERQSVNLNALVEEALNLAYHGARAQDQTFNVTMERDLDPALAPIEVVPQDLTRVFLNLFGNGFYAANKRRKEADDPEFRPALKVTTEDIGSDVVIRIRDNGVGIPPELRPKLFEPFFTTKPTGEGTGLGLSISYEIVTRQHGGTIEVESEPGAFTEFSITIPKSATTDTRANQ